MKNLISLVLLIILLSNVTCYAQNRFSFSTNINLSIVTGLALNKKSGDLDFGEVLVTNQAQTLSMSPGDGVLFEVIGQRGRRVTVTYTRRVTLANNDWVNNYGGDAGNLTFVSDVKRTGKRTTYTNPRNVRSGRSYRLRNDGSFGKLYLWVGGRIRVNSNQPVGDYIGQFTITVAY